MSWNPGWRPLHFPSCCLRLLTVVGRMETEGPAGSRQVHSSFSGSWPGAGPVACVHEVAVGDLSAQRCLCLIFLPSGGLLPRELVTSQQSHIPTRGCWIPVLGLCPLREPGSSGSGGGTYGQRAAEGPCQSPTPPAKAKAKHQWASRKYRPLPAIEHSLICVPAVGGRSSL